MYSHRLTRDSAHMQAYVRLMNARPLLGPCVRYAPSVCLSI